MECPICIEPMEVPKFLRCGHTFCVNCLRRLVERSSLRCPTCRKRIELGPGGVDDLPTNYAVIDKGPPPTESRQPLGLETLKSAIRTLETLKSDHGVQVNSVEEMIDAYVEEVMAKVEILRKKITRTSNNYQAALDKKLKDMNDLLARASTAGLNDSAYESIKGQVEHIEKETFDALDLQCNQQGPVQIVDVQMIRNKLKLSEGVNQRTAGRSKRTSSLTTGQSVSRTDVPSVRNVPSVRDVPSVRNVPSVRDSNIQASSAQDMIPSMISSPYYPLSPTLPQEHSQPRAPSTSSPMGANLENLISIVSSSPVPTSNLPPLTRTPRTIAERWCLDGVDTNAFIFIPSGELIVYHMEMRSLCMYDQQSRFITRSPHDLVSPPKALAYSELLNCVVVTHGTPTITLLNIPDLTLNRHLVMQQTSECWSIGVLSNDCFIVDNKQNGVTKNLCMCSSTQGQMLATFRTEGIVHDVRTIYNNIITSFWDIEGYTVRQGSSGQLLCTVQSGLDKGCGLAVDHHNHVWVVDRNNEQVCAFTENGQRRLMSSTVNCPWRVAISHDGLLAVSSTYQWSNRIHVFQVIDV